VTQAKAHEVNVATTGSPAASTNVGKCGGSPQKPTAMAILPRVTLESAISQFGKSRQAETQQIRGRAVSRKTGFAHRLNACSKTSPTSPAIHAVSPVGESSLSDLKTPISACSENISKPTMVSPDVFTSAGAGTLGVAPCVRSPDVATVCFDCPVGRAAA